MNLTIGKTIYPSHNSLLREWQAGIALPWWIFAVLGIDLILLGLLIVIFPRLLAWLIAGCFMFSGLLLLGIGWRFWR